MNKYQNSLNNLKTVDLDRVLDKLGHKEADKISFYGINDYPNLEMSGDIKNLQELIDKEEKYKWHDLRKDPNDLPKNNSKVFVCLLMDYGKKYYECPYHNDKFKIEFSNRIIGWKYIEEFEGE